MQETTQLRNEALKHTINEYGVAVIGVCSGYSYTLGLSKLGFPDLIIDTRDGRTAHWMLNQIFVYLREKGFQEGTNTDLFQNPDGEDLPVFLQQVEITPELKNEYIWEMHPFYQDYPEYIGENGIRLAQVIWCDPEGRMPTQDGYDHEKFPQRIFGLTAVH